MGAAESELAARLAAIGRRLGEPASAIAATLHAELVTALGQIDRALADRDRDGLVRARHAARNSALALDDARLLGALEAVGETGDGEDGALAAEWARVAPQLRRMAGGD